MQRLPESADNGDGDLKFSVGIGRGEWTRTTGLFVPNEAR